VVKIYSIDSNRRVCRAVTFMRTWLFKWIGTSDESVTLALGENGHKEGRIQDIVPLGRSI